VLRQGDQARSLKDPQSIESYLQQIKELVPTYRQQQRAQAEVVRQISLEKPSVGVVEPLTGEVEDILTEAVSAQVEQPIQFQPGSQLVRPAPLTREERITLALQTIH
jgi:hypothetical protein